MTPATRHFIFDFSKPDLWELEKRSLAFHCRLHSLKGYRSKRATDRALPLRPEEPRLARDPLGEVVIPS